MLNLQEAIQEYKRDLIAFSRNLHEAMLERRARAPSVRVSLTPYDGDYYHYLKYVRYYYGQRFQIQLEYDND